MKSTPLRTRALALVGAALLLTAAGCSAPETPENPENHDEHSQPLSTMESWPEETTSVAPPPASAAPTTTAPADPPIAPGETATVEIRVGERDRSFGLSVPEGYSHRQAWPVIFAFHGLGEDPAVLRDYTGFDDATALVIYGQGVEGSWAPAPYAQTSLDEDLDYVRAVMATVREQYLVDEDRNYATGFSNGGGFAAALGCQMTEEFEAVAAVGAAYYQTVFDDCSSEPMPYFAIHGTADNVIAYDGGTRHDSEYYSVDEVMGIMQQRNGCTGRGSIVPENEAALHVSFVDCHTPLEYVRSGGGQHVWPGSYIDSTARMPEGYATYRILEFFDVDWIFRS